MTITLTEAQHRLHTIAETYPTKVAGGLGQDCRYFEYDGTPSCIVGHAFAAELKAAGVEYHSDDNENSITGLVNHLILDIEPDAADYLQVAQESQDFGNPWAEAVRIADNQIAEILAEREGFEIEEDGQLALAV